MNSDQFLDDLEQNQSVTQVRELSEFELRLKQAQYYQLLLHNDFFDTKDVIAQQIQSEVHAFIARRCEELMGMRAEANYQPYESPFTEEEVDALKAIAAKVRERPSIVVPPKKVGRPAKETEKPIVQVQKSNQAKGKLKKVAVPDDLRESVPDQLPEPKTATKVANIQPPQLSLTPEKTTSEPEETMLGEGADGMMRMQKGNRFYRQVANAEGQIAKNSLGEPIWLDITPQAQDANNKPQPMPTGMQMTAITAQQAEEAVQMQGGNSGDINSILAKSGKISRGNI